MKKIILILVMFIAVPGMVSAAEWKMITPLQVHDLIFEGSRLWLIDVRPSSMFEESHIEGAVNIPAVFLVNKRFPKQRVLVLIDNSIGQQEAKRTAEILANQGQEGVYVLENGLRGWIEAGYTMAGKSKVSVAKVTPSELTYALDNFLSVQVIDLRDADEARTYPLETGSPADGRDLEEKLARLAENLKGVPLQPLMAGAADKATTILVFPAEINPQAFFVKYLQGIRADIRVMDGASLIPPEARKKMTVSNMEGCPTCPGTQVGGTAQ